MGCGFCGGGWVQTTPLTAPRATSSRFGLETSLSAVERYCTAAIDSKNPRMATTKADEMSGRIFDFPARRFLRGIGKRIWKDPDSTWPKTLTPDLSQLKYHVRTTVNLLSLGRRSGGRTSGEGDDSEDVRDECHPILFVASLSDAFFEISSIKWVGAEGGTLR